MLELGLPVLILLVAIALVGGIGITALGPGGVLVTIGLFTLTDLTPAMVAGTSIVTHIGTGLLGTAVYLRSGQLREPVTRRTSVVLAATALVGTPIGVLVNSLFSVRAFGVLLGVFVAVVALLVLSRERRTRHLPEGADPRHPLALLVLLGLGISVVSGMFGVGGPMLSVPVLIAIGVPLLPALAAAQAQSIVIASVGSVGYAMQGAVDWPLALLVGIPEALGVVIGWRIAHAIPTRRLKVALVAALLALAPYLALHG
nr:sulfite exporter TauE/SafE family protein [Microbacterium bovistercoris]